ncbi:hypothetical protein NC652_009134 [Populus alba x Populus x berolinensis]|nr:hypothetical protein NC652_009134 [Populus alba x Populus x berolinensis]
MWPVVRSYFFWGLITQHLLGVKKKELIPKGFLDSYLRKILWYSKRNQ